MISIFCKAYLYIGNNFFEVFSTKEIDPSKLFKNDYSVCKFNNFSSDISSNGYDDLDWSSLLLTFFYYYFFLSSKTDF
jgi:hypothetical protein